MRFIKELIHRRIPHIIGSYLIAGTSLILFVDWLVNRYTLPDHYTTLSLFGVIAIMPSVIILAYFHGAPGKDEWTNIEKIGIPVNLIFILFVLLIGHHSNWWFENKSIENNNYYIHFTSSINYIKHYKIHNNNSASFVYTFSSEKYIIESVNDTIMDQIKHSVFRNVSSDYANQGINVDVNFTKEEDAALNRLYHPTINPLSNEQKDTLTEIINTIISVLDTKYDNYDSILPNTIIRYFIYQITDLETREKFYAYQGAAQWGRSFRTHSSSQYGAWSKRYAINEEGYIDFINDLSNAAKGKIKERIYSGGISGEIIEKLDHALVRIRQYHPGSIKKKMKLKSLRDYVWDEGGVDILIEDYMMYVEYMQNTDLKKQWEYDNLDSLNVWNNNQYIYNQSTYQNEVDKEIESLLYQIEDFKDKIGTGYFQNNVGMNTGDHEYYLEVTAVEDSIVIAKIVGSRHPVYNVRKGDLVYIAK